MTLRVWHLFQTGFILPDEGMYLIMIREELGIHILDRPLFKFMLFFSATLSNDPFIQITLFLFMNLCFAVGALYTVTKIAETTKTSFWSIPFFVCTPAFFLYIPFVLTETPALFFALCGAYFFLNGKFKYVPVSFFLASLFREVYLIFLVGVSIYCLLKYARKKHLTTLLFFGIMVVILVSVSFFTSTSVQKAGFGGYSEWTFTDIGPLPKFSFIERVLYSARNFLLSLFFSSPVAGLLIFFEKVKKIDVLAISGYITSLAQNFYAGIATWYATLGAISVALRFASPSLIVFPYSKWISKKAFLSNFLMLMILFPLGFHFGALSQNTLDVFTEAPWLRLSNYVKGQEGVLIYGEPLMRVKFFISDTVTCKLPVYEEDFYQDLNGEWQTLLLYGEKHPKHYLLLPSWYAEFLNNGSYEIIWEDTESYLYEVERQ